MLTLPSNLLTDAEVSQILSMPLRRLRALAREGQITYVDLHSDDTLRFHPTDVAEYIEAHRIPTELMLPTLPVM